MEKPAYIYGNGCTMPEPVEFTVPEPPHGVLLPSATFFTIQTRACFPHSLSFPLLFFPASGFYPSPRPIHETGPGTNDDRIKRGVGERCRSSEGISFAASTNPSFRGETIGGSVRAVTTPAPKYPRSHLRAP